MIARLLLTCAALTLALDPAWCQRRQASARARLARQSAKPLAAPAANPRAGVAKLLEGDPAFGKLVANQNAAWRDRLSEAVKGLGHDLRSRPIVIRRPGMPSIPRPSFRGSLPSVRWPTWRWPRMSLPSFSLPSAPSWLPRWTMPSAPSWPSWLRVRFPAWMPSWSSWRFPWPSWPSAAVPKTIGSPGWTWSWVYAVAMALLTLLSLYTASLFALLLLTRIGRLRALAGTLALMLARWLPRALAALVARWVGRLTPEPEAAPRRAAASAKPQADGSAGDPPPVDLAARTVRSWKDYARELMAEGQGREALRALYLAMMRRLDEAGLIDYEPHLTNWDYRMQLPRGEIRDAFARLCRLFDRTWYGEYPCDQALFDEGDRLVDAILGAELAA